MSPIGISLNRNHWICSKKRKLSGGKSAPSRSQPARGKAKPKKVETRAMWKRRREDISDNDSTFGLVEYDERKEIISLTLIPKVTPQILFD